MACKRTILLLLFSYACLQYPRVSYFVVQHFAFLIAVMHVTCIYLIAVLSFTGIMITGGMCKVVSYSLGLCKYFQPLSFNIYQTRLGIPHSNRTSFPFQLTGYLTPRLSTELADDGTVRRKMKCTEEMKNARKSSPLSLRTLHIPSTQSKNVKKQDSLMSQENTCQ